MSRKLPIRSTYTVKTLLNDLKKMKLTPSGLHTVGAEVVYHELQEAIENLGEQDPIVVYLEELLNFMQVDYERRLIEGDLRREKDTPGATINSFLKETPMEFQSYVLERPGEFMSGVLRAVEVVNQREIERYKRMEKGLLAQLEDKQDDSELWNQLRLVLWILGRYADMMRRALPSRKQRNEDGIKRSQKQLQFSFHCL